MRGRKEAFLFSKNRMLIKYRKCPNLCRYSFVLRCPVRAKSSNAKAHIESTLESLELSSCADVRIEDGKGNNRVLCV